jgi:hypothetical protein
VHFKREWRIIALIMSDHSAPETAMVPVRPQKATIELLLEAGSGKPTDLDYALFDARLEALEALEPGLLPVDGFRARTLRQAFKVVTNGVAEGRRDEFQASCQVLIDRVARRVSVLLSNASDDKAELKRKARAGRFWFQRAGALENSCDREMEKARVIQGYIKEGRAELMAAIRNSFTNELYLESPDFAELVDVKAVLDAMLKILGQSDGPESLKSFMKGWNEAGSALKLEIVEGLEPLIRAAKSGGDVPMSVSRSTSGATSTIYSDRTESRSTTGAISVVYTGKRSFPSAIAQYLVLIMNRLNRQRIAILDEKVGEFLRS